MDGEHPDRPDLLRLAAATEVLLSVAERVDGEIADETILAELYELRDRAYSALHRLSERSGANGSHWPPKRSSAAPRATADAALRPCATRQARGSPSALACSLSAGAPGYSARRTEISFFTRDFGNGRSMGKWSALLVIV